MSARLTGVDNARESVDEQGRIQGIIASKTGSGRLDQGINKVAEKYPSFAEILGTVKQAVLKDTDANIDFKSGVEMTIELIPARGMERRREWGEAWLQLSRKKACLNW